MKNSSSSFCSYENLHIIVFPLVGQTINAFCTPLHKEEHVIKKIPITIYFIIFLD